LNLCSNLIDMALDFIFVIVIVSVIFLFCYQRLYALMTESMTAHGKKSWWIHLSILSFADWTLEFL
jgi:hypothetical protein